MLELSLVSPTMCLKERNGFVPNGPSVIVFCTTQLAIQYEKGVWTAGAQRAVFGSSIGFRGSEKEANEIDHTCMANVCTDL